MMHLTISGILISMKYGRTKPEGFSSWVMIIKIKNQEFDRKMGEMW